MAVGALSAIRYEPAKSALEKNLESSDADLRYDSAVALARLKDEKAVPVLLEMLNLKPNDSLQGTEKAKNIELVQSSQLAGIEGAQELSDASLKAKIADLAKNAADIKVQEAALGVAKK
jgi:HEAT repeat protein